MYHLESDSRLIPKSLLETTALAMGLRSTPSSSTARVTGPARRTAAAMHLVVLQKDAPGDEATKAVVKKVTTFCKEYYLKKDPSAAV